jgi:hypothetical protein
MLHIFRKAASPVGMTVDDLFALFGGRDALMDITRSSRVAIYNWRAQGVPYKHWQALTEAADRLGIKGVTLATLRTTRPITDRRQPVEFLANGEQQQPPHTSATRAKMSAIRKAAWADPARARKMAAGISRAMQTPSVRAQISAAKHAWKPPPEHKRYYQRMLAAGLGRTAARLAIETMTKARK